MTIETALNQTRAPDEARRPGWPALPVFFALCFGLTWGLAAFIMLWPALFQALFGRLSVSNPIFILAVAAPTLSATVLTLVREGWPGLRALYSQLFRWRFGWPWYALLLLGLPLLGYLVTRFTGQFVQYDLSTPALLLGLLLNELVLGPLGEELGWRGFALPRLLRRFNPLAASLVLGVIWGLWHLPAFFVSGLPQTGLAIPVFLLGALCLSVLATWLYLHTGRSVLSGVLFHFMYNVTLDVLGVPLPAFAAVMALAVVLVLALDRRLGWLRRPPADILPDPLAARAGWRG